MLLLSYINVCITASLALELGKGSISPQDVCSHVLRGLLLEFQLRDT